uniref:Retrotransposon gag domain-containing protein n=1 Tax=Tanacetum cinerariifolium TaxID=118510 RepID=A0A6L2LII5_TANCI|nr:hypothetical protein [Tanacetum cinerariifolium]
MRIHSSSNLIVTSSQFHGFEKDDPRAHIRWFNKITSMLKYKNVPHDAIKLMLFPFSLERAARTWLEKEPTRSIHTWEDLVSKFVNYFFPLSKTMNLKNVITGFQQKFKEMFSAAWDRFKELLRKCPHHGFLELHQIDTFYNSLTQSDQDSLNAAAGGNLLNRTPRDALTIIENKSKVRTSRNKLVVYKVNTTTSSSSPSLEITALTDMVRVLVLMNKANKQAYVKAVEETCVTCGGLHPYYECLATDSNTFNDFAATGAYNQGGNRYRPQGDLNYRVSNHMGPPDFPSLNVQNSQNYNQSQGNYQALKYQDQVGPLNELTNYMKSNEATLRAMRTQMTNMNTKLQNEFKSMIDTRTNKIENQSNQIMSMLTNMQKQNPLGSRLIPSNTVANPRGEVKAITTQSGVTYDGPTIPPTPSPLSKPKPSIPYPSRHNDQKLREKTNIQMLKFIQFFQRLHFDLSFADDVVHIPKFASTFKSLLSNKEKLFELANTPLTKNCSAVLFKKLPKKLRDLGDLYHKLSLPDLTSTRMTLELATRTFAYLAGIAEDVFVQVGKFTFLADFVVVDYDVDPCVPLILGRPFLRTARTLVDVHGEELILRDCDEQFLFHMDNTLKHPYKHANNTAPLSDSSPSLTPFETSDSLLEEFADELAFLDPIPPGKKDNNFDFEANLREIEFLSPNEPSLAYLPPQGDNDDDDDDIFDRKSNNDEWKNLLYGDCYKDINSEKAINKDSKKKSLVIEDHIVESNDLLPRLLHNSLTLLEESSESSEKASLFSFPFENKDKVFNLSILILGGTHILKDESKDKDLRDKDLILEDRNVLSISSDKELMFFLELTLLRLYYHFHPKIRTRITLDFEDSRANGFVLRSIELQPSI